MSVHSLGDTHHTFFLSRQCVFITITVTTDHHYLQSTQRKEHSKKTSTASPSNATSTIVDPANCKLLRRAKGGRVLEETPVSKKKKLPEDSPKASKKKASKPISDDLKILDDKCIVSVICTFRDYDSAKTFAVPVEPVQ